MGLLSGVAADGKYQAADDRNKCRD